MSGAPIRAMDAAAITKAAEHIRAGRLVAFGTETVYGLGADAGNDRAVAAIYAAKGRPSFNPLISHVHDVASAALLGDMDARATTLADALWPGPLTLVLNKKGGAPVSKLTTAGLETVAVRVPAREAARAFLAEAGVPVAAPSANRSGAISPTRAEHVVASLLGPGDGGPVMILDDGPCDIGLESTVVDLSTDTATLLRPGGVTLETLKELIGPVALAGSDDHAPKSPGMLSRHYAPSASLRIDARTPRPGEVFLGFGDINAPNGLNLSATGDLLEAAANLFEMLHRLDKSPDTKIAVAPIPNTGLGRAINDRLKRAVKN